MRNVIWIKNNENLSGEMFNNYIQFCKDNNLKNPFNK